MQGRGAATDPGVDLSPQVLLFPQHIRDSDKIEHFQRRQETPRTNPVTSDTAPPEERRERRRYEWRLRTGGSRHLKALKDFYRDLFLGLWAGSRRVDDLHSPKGRVRRGTSHLGLLEWSLDLRPVQEWGGSLVVPVDKQVVAHKGSVEDLRSRHNPHGTPCFGGSGTGVPRTQGHPYVHRLFVHTHAPSPTGHGAFL